MAVVHLAADLLDDRLLEPVELGLVLLEEIATMGVDRDDERTELLDAHDPHGLGLTEFGPVALLDLLDAFGGEHGAAAREDAVHGLAFLTAGSSLGTHAALADDDLHARFPEEFALVLLHAHGGRRADGDDAEAGAALVVGNHDGTGVEDGLAGEVVRKVHAFLDMAEVNHVAAILNLSSCPLRFLYVIISSIWCPFRTLPNGDSMLTVLIPFPPVLKTFFETGSYFPSSSKEKPVY